MWLQQRLTHFSLIRPIKLHFSGTTIYNFLFRIAYEVCDDQNNGYEQLRICQNEAGKFSKALANQFDYLVESLQTGKIGYLEHGR